MLFLSITKPELTQHATSKADAIELRLDLFTSIDLCMIHRFIENASCPIMLTIRKQSQGGNFQRTESERETLIEQLLDLKPQFFDLEYDMRPEFLHAVFAKYLDTKFILSYHNFQKTPPDLENIYLCMLKYPAFSYKIATMAHSTNDALKMLLFSKTHPKTSAICMGEKGNFARILGPVSKNLIGYASFDSNTQTGPGQLTISDLTTIYRYPSLNENTSIYGLIGDPVEKSPGHLYHNAIFQKRHLNAVYVKMIVKPEELFEFIPLAIALGIQGLSVTIPLKEKILPFLDEIDPVAKQIGAVNTLRFRNGKIFGTNTDGLGALDAIEKTTLVRGKTVVLLGAGGAARAIAFEAKARGADVLILNRTVQRAEELAKELGCKAGALEEIPHSYDILINCCPGSIPIDPEKIKPKTLAMDIVYFPKETEFLKIAFSKQCRIIYGEEMFYNQAARQTAFWFNL